MADIQSATTESRQGKKKKETTAAEYNGLPYWTAIAWIASMCNFWILLKQLAAYYWPFGPLLRIKMNETVPWWLSGSRWFF